MRDDDAQPIINAIRLLKGVIDVVPHIADPSHHFAVEAAKSEIRNKILELLV